jgi:hypothetical protein
MRAALCVRAGFLLLFALRTTPIPVPLGPSPTLRAQHPAELTYHGPRRRECLARKKSSDDALSSTTASRAFLHELVCARARPCCARPVFALAQFATKEGLREGVERSRRLLCKVHESAAGPKCALRGALDGTTRASRCGRDRRRRHGRGSFQAEQVALVLLPFLHPTSVAGGFHDLRCSKVASIRAVEKTVTSARANPRPPP